MSETTRPKTVEMKGPCGLRVVREDEVPAYQGRGYEIVSQPGKAATTPTRARKGTPDGAEDSEPGDRVEGVQE